MKKPFYCLIAVVLILALVGCAAKQSAPAASDQIANPFVDCDTLADAEKLAGFTLTAPEQAGGAKVRLIQAIEGQMIQIFYGEEGHSTLVRKGSGSEDISGDYNKYDTESTLPVNGKDISTRGGDGVVHAATWTEGDYTYAINSDDGLTEAELTTLVAEVE